MRLPRDVTLSLDIHGVFLFRQIFTEYNEN
nr:MAG TPA: hypothetical protein [Caudoviricetes sp.]